MKTETETRYRIVRFRKNKHSQNVRGLTNLSLSQARNICEGQDSRGRTWFFGFTQM
jgi:hypothetical protein